jgi:hypothetical protein
MRGIPEIRVKSRKLGHPKLGTFREQLGFKSKQSGSKIAEELKKKGAF